MSKQSWGTNIKAISEDTVKKISAKKYSRFMAFFKKCSIDPIYFAKMQNECSGEDSDYFDSIHADALSHVEEILINKGEDENISLYSERLFNALCSSYAKLLKDFQEKTGASLHLFSTVADSDNADSYFWEIENYFIVNPGINFDALEDIKDENIVQCG